MHLNLYGLCRMDLYGFDLNLWLPMNILEFICICAFLDNIECIRCLFGLHAMIIMIYVNCLYYLGYHIRNKQKKRIRDLCRVQKPWHTAKEPMFAVCQSQGTRQTFELCRVPRRQAHGKGGRHVTSQVFCFFLPWVNFDTRQKLCRVPDKWHTANDVFADV